MIKTKFFFLSVILYLLLFHPLSIQAKSSSPANNKVGIHILQPSEINLAAELVNSQGGDWGYVTIPIQPTDRDLSKWTQFMLQAKQLHLIPILRITTIPQGGTWAQAQATDLVDFANFLNELPWPIKNRYVIIFNEVNRDQEWGDHVDPQAYAQILKNAYLIFKQRSPNFFILPAGLDNALPDSTTSLSSRTYWQQMQTAIPNIWDYIDGWNSHAYPNPNFAASPYKTGWQSITSYRQELNFINKSLPVFITETGWDQTKIKNIYFYYQKAWQIWLNDPLVKAVTPFVLQGGQQFKAFSFLSPNGKPTPAWQATFDLPKIAGKPDLSSPQPISNPATISKSSHQNIKIPSYHSPLNLLLKIENFFRQLLNLPIKQQLKIKDSFLLVEVAKTPKQIEKGLSHRSQLPPQSGMLFVFDHPYQAKFWMKNMRFPLDIIWIYQQHIVGFSLNLPPEGDHPKHIYLAPQPVDMVLEVPAGYVQKHKLKIGDTIELL